MFLSFYFLSQSPIKLAHTTKMHFPYENYFLLSVFQGFVYLCYFPSAKTCIYLCLLAIFVSLFAIDVILVITTWEKVVLFWSTNCNKVPS